MPKLKDIDASEIGKTSFGFNYSHIGVDKLEASNYTIVHITTDKSGSVAGFSKELEDINKTCVESCQDSPESENLLIRSTAFDSDLSGVDIEELHGYTLLSAIDPNQYDGSIIPRGGTPLYDATLDAILSLTDFGQKVWEDQHICNSILFVITDGDENDSQNKDVKIVREAMDELHRHEQIESFVSILIGLNTSNQRVADFLNNYHKDAGFDAYIDIKNSTKKELAKLAKFVSQSVSSQSQHCGSGGPSQIVDYQSLSI